VLRKFQNRVLKRRSKRNNLILFKLGQTAAPFWNRLPHRHEKAGEVLAQARLLLVEVATISESGPMPEGADKVRELPSTESILLPRTRRTRMLQDCQKGHHVEGVVPRPGDILVERLAHRCWFVPDELEHEQHNTPSKRGLAHLR
jgi:hypothetical protein